MAARSSSIPHLHAAKEGVDGGIFLSCAAPHLLHHDLQQRNGLPGGCLQGLHGLGRGGLSLLTPPRSHAPPSRGPLSPAHQHGLLQPLAALHVSRLQVHAVGSTLPAGGSESPLLWPPRPRREALPPRYPPLHIPETADAQQRLLVGGEHDVGLRVQRCGGGAEAERSGRCPPPTPPLPGVPRPCLAYCTSGSRRGCAGLGPQCRGARTCVPGASRRGSAHTGVARKCCRSTWSRRPGGQRWFRRSAPADCGLWPAREPQPQRDSASIGPSLGQVRG